MKNKTVKIVYNWIGPYGAIPNDELPNVFNISHAGGAQLNSSKYFTEDIWNKFFRENKNFELGTVFGLKEDDHFIFPFFLRWRVPFAQYFYNNNGLLEWAHVPREIVHYVRNHNGYFLIDCATEAYIERDHLFALHGYFNYLEIPLHKIIYLTGCMNSKEMYEEFLVENNLSVDKNDKLSIISFPTSHSEYSSKLKYESNELDYDTNLIPEKLFLSWNRRFRPHRVVLALLLEKYNLIDRSFISMNRVSDEFSNQTFENSIPYEVSIDEDIKDKFVEKLPLVLDGENRVEFMCSDPESSTLKYYKNSLVSIITETNFLTRYVTLTEKSFKPVRFKHPFILVGAVGTLKAMRSLGFKTFDKFWDESYDLIEDPYERLEAIANVCNTIGNWTNEQILKFKKNVKSILDYNYNHLKHNSSEELIKNIISKIDIDFDNELIEEVVHEKNIQEEIEIMQFKPKKILVCGAGGFIGSHLVKYLKNQGHYVIGADLKTSEYMEDSCDQFSITDLRNKNEVENLLSSDIDEIYQLAADMGGAGYVFTGENDTDIMHNNVLINLNVLRTMKEKGIKKVFFSSSACIYPEYNQMDPFNPICSESSAYPAAPDSEYGWEKLFSERLYKSYEKEGIQVRIARFHNIFGPYGSWNNGREKAPAAICRKIAESNNGGTVEIWGDGTQTRSFLFIDDALEGIDRIMNGDYSEPLNLGSDEMITINDLVKIVSNIAKKGINIKYINGPTGVNGRNSDNTLIAEKLSWKPENNLLIGLTKTYHWILSQVNN